MKLFLLTFISSVLFLHSSLDQKIIEQLLDDQETQIEQIEQDQLKDDQWLQDCEDEAADYGMDNNLTQGVE